MSKDSTKYNSQNTSYHLDTLAQLSTSNCKELFNKELEYQDKDKINLQKRARAKAFTNSYLFDLIDLKSPLNKSYWNTFHCSTTILQEGKKFTAKYCNNRWCLVCNRIRTAKMINGYISSIESFKEPRFVTLTIPNVLDKDLKSSINEMSKALRDITKNLKKTYGIKLKALRKYECTYNKFRGDFHPHYHLIVEGENESKQLVNLWLNRFKTADKKGQENTKADSTSLNELCKYFTKIIAKDTDYNPKALDIMFRAVKGQRTFQSIGIRKYVSEEVEEIQSQEVEFKESRNEIWGFDYGSGVYDWTTADGELLSEYEPTKKDLKVINKIYDTH